MTAVFPPVPRVVFTIIEPISLIAGFLGPLIDAQFFTTSQLPSALPHPLLPTEQVLALQLGNCYLLLCLVGLAVLNTTTEARVVHAYIWALWLADIGHVWITAYCMGSRDFWDISRWNSVVAGNIGATGVLFALRSLYMLGVFGPDQEPATGGTKAASKLRKKLV